MTTQCIAHSALVTGYDGQPRDFAHCGVCRQRMERDWSADPIMPRNAKGRPMGATSKAREAHRSEWARRMAYGVAKVVIEAQTGMSVDAAADEYRGHFYHLLEPRFTHGYLTGEWERC